MSNEAGTDQGTDNQPQGTSNGWELIPQEYREMSEIKRFEKGGIPELVKGTVELSKMASGMVKMPTDKSQPDEWEKFYEKLGRPAKPDGYKIDKPKLEGVAIDDGLLSRFTEVAHKAGYTQKQVQEAINFQAAISKEIVDAQIAQNKQLNDQRWDKYKKEWGDTKTKENIELAKQAFKELAPEELKEIMTVDDVETDPILVKMYSTFWRKTMDDKLVQGDQIKKEEYTPRYPKSPEIYRNDRSEEGAKAREYFTKQGFKY